jgi:hypothetical protein
MAGENIDLSSSPSIASDPTEANASSRPFVGINFTCCDVYARIYLNRDRTGYVGHCPRCARKVELRIGPGGTDRRFFRAS